MRGGRSYWGGKHQSEDYDGSLSVKRVQLNNGGYTSTGRYFGSGGPLWSVDNYHDPGVFGDIDFYIRAANRTEALQEVRGMYPLTLGIMPRRKSGRSKIRHRKAGR